MDHFGIGSAMKAMIRIYSQSARCSGRTTSMIESIKDGDMIIFSNAQEAHNIRQALLNRGLKNIKCIVVDPKYPEDLIKYRGYANRAIFDHSWVEEFYRNGIEYYEKRIDAWQSELSRNKKVDRQTDRAAWERCKWGS